MKQFVTFLLLLTSIVLRVPSTLQAQVAITQSVTATGVVLTGSVPGMAAYASTVTSFDDSYSGAVPIGFTFNYYGNTYTQCLIGSNGLISFNMTSATGYCPWSITSPLLGHPSAFNSICMPWCDMDPGSTTPTATISYHTEGAAPNRKFVVTFCSTPLSSCTGVYNSSSAILYEGSNIIDLLVAHHDAVVCGASGGKAIEGIENMTGTAATVVPGRNYPTIWAATDDAFRFAPVGGGASYSLSSIPYVPLYAATDVTIYWYDSATGAFAGSGSTITVHPVVPTTYKAVAVACMDSFSTGYIAGVVSSCTGLPTAGVVAANTAAACATTIVTLTNTGYSIGAALQWQSSGDGVSWTDIPGATGIMCTVSGITATTYYRCLATCIAGGAFTATAPITITYTSACPCVMTYPGTIIANAAYSCPTATVTLTDSSYSASAVGLQWQSSADSSTWNDISGATSPILSFTGLTVTTFYRLKFNCVSGSGEMATAGIKIRYTPTCVCSGMPTAGIATASTSTCSSCLLTLNLSGYSLGDSLAFQWQASTDSFTWADIAGISIPYSFYPSQPSYYRCKVTCIPTGAVDYSTPVFVLYLYHITADSVSSTTTYCTNPRFYVRVNGSTPLLRLKSYYGDGYEDSLALISSTLTSYTNTVHNYSAPGVYSVKQVLYYNNVPIDSVMFSYTYHYCTTFPIKLYVDGNSDCVKNATEWINFMPVQVQVDSNGVTIDTISATGGFYYPANGGPGTNYDFSVIPGGFVSTCPAIHYTVSVLATSYAEQYLGLHCGSIPMDLTVYEVTAGSGPNRHRGDIYAYNQSCTPINATVLLNHSIRYNASANSSPAYTTATASTMSWDITGLSASVAAPQHMYFDVWAPSSATLTAGDTASDHVIITPIIGDADSTDNRVVIIDTVKGSYDPNYVAVVPTACLPTAQTHLQYTVHFENTGNDTAFNIHIMDTLAANVDLNSLRILMSSATMDVTLLNNGGYNVVKFDFPNINLLDSSHHGL